LVDTLVSGTSDRKVVQVRVLFRALREVIIGFLFYLLSISYTLHDSTHTHLEKHVGNISGLNINLSLLKIIGILTSATKEICHIIPNSKAALKFAELRIRIM